MPEYSFKHPKKEKYIDVFFHMSDEKNYVDEKGVKWERVYSKPNAKIDSCNPYSAERFVQKTNNMKGTIGDIQDAAAELGQKRAEKNDGIDPVTQKHFDDYRKRVGKESYNETKLKQKKNIVI